MNGFSLYPLRFEPVYQYRPWGGRRLASLLSAPLPGDDPIGEAWLLSDRDDHPSLVADGPLKGKTIQQLIALAPEQLLGKLAGHFVRFPLLLKFLDVRERISVQVHPSDAFPDLIPAGETGKTEAWVVVEAGVGSRIYAGLKRGTTTETLREAVEAGTVSEYLTSFPPKRGECVLIRAGTVHSLNDIVVFEVQQNSDVTFRLFDWNNVDPRTGRHRLLQIDQAMECINFTQGEVVPIKPQMEETKPGLREKLLYCEHFGVWRISGESPIMTGEAGTPRVLVCLAGRGHMEYARADYAVGKGDVMLLPAVVGACICRPHDAMTLLEISLPETA